MEIILLVVRIFLALVLGVAGIAKAADIAGTRRAMIGFGIPEKLAYPLGWCLPFAEILIALALLPLNTAWWGAVAALALLLIFVAGISVSLARGESPDCHCFGQLHSQPVSRSVLTRNLVLAAAAALVVVQGKSNPGLSALGWLADLKAGEVFNLILSVVAVALLTTAVVYLRKVIGHQATLLEKIEAMKKLIDEDYYEPPPVEREEATAPVEGLPIGALAPDFSLTAVGEEQVTLDKLLSYGKSVLLLFVSPNCSPCKNLLPMVKDWERDYGDHLTIAVLSKGSPEENRQSVEAYGMGHLLSQGTSSVAGDYLAKWTPAAVLVNRNGRIASRMARGEDAVRDLVAHLSPSVNAQSPKRNGAAVNGHRLLSTDENLPFKLGDPSPKFSAPDLNGRLISIDDLLGRDTLLLFWDPKCPWCKGMSEDLRRSEENPPKGAPRLVFISTGNAEDTNAESKNFKAQFLHDPEFNLGPLFGTGQTPSAVLIDREGKIASNLVKGVGNVLPLLGIRKVQQQVAASA